MSVIRPFAAIRYNTASSRDLSTRLAPPYDVLSADDKRALLARDPNNFVELDLPHVPAKEAGPPAVYSAVHEKLQAWLRQGVLTHDSRPAIYPYFQRYSHGGATYLRKKFFARLRLTPFGEGDVYPHERTFGGPKEDRLALTKATLCNLSPIFGLYPDASNTVLACLERALPDSPLMQGTLDGIESTVWAITESATIDELTRLMADKPIYIADGHHRYGTSLLYREWLESQQGKLPPEHPANYVLCVFCGMEDTGLLILPTHRVLPTLGYVDSSLRHDAELEVIDLRATSAEGVQAELARLGPQAVGLYSNASRSYCAIRPRSAEILAQLEPEHSAAWRHLGLAFLHAYLLDRVITPKLLDGQPPEIQYIKSAGDAVDLAVATDGSAFLMQPTTMRELADVCAAGDLMPQKSTFFYPKLASGLVVNPLSE